MDLLDGFFGAILGSAIGAIATICSAKFTLNKQFESERSKKEKENNELKLNVLMAIRHEIKTLWDAYSTNNPTLQEKLKNIKAGEPFESIYQLKQEYFHVYRNNCRYIGMLNEDTAQAIIKFYIDATGLIDSFTLNNELINQILEYIKLSAMAMTNQQSRKIINEIPLKQYANYGIKLKALNKNIKISKTIALTKLDKEINKLKQ